MLHQDSTPEQITPSRRAVMRGVLGLGLAATATAGSGVLPLPRAVAAGELLNAGFEQVTDGWPTDWEPFNAASRDHIASADDAAHSGDRSVRIADQSTTSVGLRSSRLPIEAGTVYEGSVQVLVEKGRASVYLEFWDEAGSRVSSSFQETRYLGDWHEVRVSGEAPDGAAHASLLLYSPQSNRGTAWFDDAAIDQVRTLPVETYGTAAFTAAIRGAALLGDRLFVTSRHTVDGKLRLAEVDLETGDTVWISDLDLGGGSGQQLAHDGTYLYVGAAGHGSIWRVDPDSREAEEWAPIGGSTLWAYDLRYHEGYLYLGTYPDCMVRRIRVSDGQVEVYGRVSTSLYATAAVADEEYVYGGSASPGRLLRWPKEGGGEPLDLTPQLSESPVGILDMVASGGLLYIASGRELITIRPDGSERVSRSIPEEDRYIDQLTVAPDGTVYALARLTTNIYRVDAETLTPIARPHDDVENILLDLTDDGRFVGVSGVGDVWTVLPGGEAEVFSLTSSSFAYPDEVQSMLLHSRGQRLWVGGHYSMTVHNLGAQTSESFYAPGEPKAMVQGADGTVYAGMYPSTNIVAYHPRTFEPTVLGTIGHGQMRVKEMHYDQARHQLLIATGASNRSYSGALTFVDLRTGEFDVHVDILPGQRPMDIAVAGDVAYIVGDTWGDGNSGPSKPAGDVAAVDLTTREVLWRRELDPDWQSYEGVVHQDGQLYLMGRRPRGPWFLYDLASESIIHRGDLGGYGEFGQSRGRVFSWVHWTFDIRELPSAKQGTERLLHADVPNGWYNNQEFCWAPNGKQIWGVWGPDLAKFTLI